MNDHSHLPATQLPETTDHRALALPVQLSRDMAAQRITQRAQSLVALIDLADPGVVPEDIKAAAAELWGAMAGPGASDLNLQPGSLEIIGDPALHARALAEAQAKVVRRDREIDAELANLPADMQADVVEYNRRTDSTREAVANAYEEGKVAGYQEGLKAAGEGGDALAEAYRKGWDACAAQLDIGQVPESLVLDVPAKD